MADVASGLLLMTSPNFRVGDMIKAGDVQGQVMSVVRKEVLSKHPPFSKFQYKSVLTQGFFYFIQHKPFT